MTRSPDFIRAGVIGHPLRHSKSPLIHSHWIAQYGLNGSYEAVDIAPDNLQDGITRLIEDGCAGFNVTIPHKQSIFAMCDTLDDAARAIGAVNTVVIKDGKLSGHNTDAFGFIENLRQEISDIRFEEATCVVLGAGGAARAIVYGLLQQGAGKIIIANRTKQNADDLAAHYPEKAFAEDWKARHDILSDADFLINTTSLGMEGKDFLDIDLTRLKRDAIVSDIVYVPSVTPLLAQAAAQGNRTVSGLGMLLHQARPAFEKWFGVLPDVNDALKEKLQA